MSYRQIMNMKWVGAAGSFKSQHFYTLDNPPANLGGAAAILAALEACSAGYVEGARLCPALVVGGVLRPSPYATTDDYAKLQLRSAADELVDINIPAPLAAILIGGSANRVDLGHADVAALISALITYGASSSGSPLVSVVNTLRMKLRQ